ncbi:endolytic transglycosylase MltG [Fictibacillus iocasae]|uniref:Endolytic murein transglycosylase n=1 Tax=Fictibacillus iocasae TaxID=2715437 RepID=A0ABW2NQH9_9BACL
MLHLHTSTISGPQNEKKKKSVKKIILGVVFILLLLIAGLAIGLYFYGKSLLQPADPDSTKDVSIVIPIGSSTKEISQTLEEKGLIKNASFFHLYARIKNESNFQAGSYSLNPSMDLKQIISALKEGKLFKKPGFTITIPEGWNVPETASHIAEKTGMKKEDVLKLMSDPSFLAELEKKNTVLGKDIYKKDLYYPLEGYLFPATYEFEEKKPDPKVIIETMVEKADEVIGKYSTEMEKTSYTPFQIVTLASLIEEESQRDEDRGKISGVFYNRLSKDMRLDSDPTVKYARKDFSVQVLYKDLEFASPYNTYFVKGIPVGPISSPGEESIKAALNPIKMDALFFYARPNGEVIYTKTLAEHNAVYKKYRDEWDKWNEKK